MNIRKRLEHLATLSGKDRHTGRTARACRDAIEMQGILIAANLAQVKLLEKMAPCVVAKSMEVNLDGYSGPFVFDHFAVETLLMKAANKIAALEKENEALRHIADYYQHGPAQSLKESQNELPEGD